MITYFDKILYLYPNIQGVSYWSTQYNGEPWENAYDGIVWENKDIPKPSQLELDALDDAVVEAELAARAETARKTARDEAAKSDLTILAGYDSYKLTHANATLSQYLDYLESLT